MILLMHWGQVLSELFQHETLRPLWRIAHWAYKASSQLYVFDKGRYCGSIPSAQGVRQGDCLSALLFSLSVHKFYARCNEVKGVHCVGITDDLNLVGSVQGVFDAFDTLSREVLGTGLRIRHGKCGLLCPQHTCSCVGD